eukprot:191599-Amphidinium_carterae.1
MGPMSNLFFFSGGFDNTRGSYVILVNHRTHFLLERWGIDRALYQAAGLGTVGAIGTATMLCGARSV